MKVKLLTSLSGPAGSWNCGDEYECDAEEAASLIAVGFAEQLDGKADANAKAKADADAQAKADADKKPATAAKNTPATPKKTATAK